MQRFRDSIVADYVYISIVNYVVAPALRIELYGCPLSEFTVGRTFESKHESSSRFQILNEKIYEVTL